ncbi:hypothetical protein T190820D02B_10519 [Tenacibaculum sp. 190524A05c]
MINIEFRYQKSVNEITQIFLHQSKIELLNKFAQKNPILTNYNATIIIFQV